MRDRDLETLLRMSGELDDFERECGRIGRPRRERVASPLVIRLRRLTMVAAAAAVVWVALRVDWNDPGALPDDRVVRATPVVAPRIAVNVCSTIPNPMTAERPAGYRVQPTVGEDCSLVALLRTWSSECGCLLWELHEFENGSAVAQVEGGQAIDLVGSETAEVVVVAVAHAASALSNANDKAELLSCLDSNTRDVNTGPDARSSRDIVAACLPRDVTIVSHRLGDPR